MIEYKTGDLFAEDVEALVNSVNCVGVMGRGIALQFKNSFPDNYKKYVAACKRQEVRPGHMFVFVTHQLANPRYIINFPTKRHWRGKSRLEDIESGLRALVQEIRERGIRSIAIPALGSDLGGLEWTQVRQRIEVALREYEDIKVVVFPPGSAPADGRGNRSNEVPSMTPGRAALICLIHQYYIGLLDPFITLLELHKLMYFMQETGEPLRLNFKQGPFGPYAENLRHVLKAVEGHFVQGYADGGDAPNKRLELVEGSFEAAQSFLHNVPASHEHFRKVVDLVSGYESSFGLELLATVHWVASQQTYTSEQAVVDRVYAWNERKQQFSQRQIGQALRVLEEQGWLATTDEESPPSLLQLSQ